MHYRFSELVDLEQILALMSAFHKLTRIPSTIIDLDGNILKTKDGRMVGVGWKSICLDFHRVHPVTERNCVDSDVRLASEAMCSGGGSYKCLNGLVDAAIPLTIDGEHLANLLTGQFLLAPPDLAEFRARAGRHGFDQDRYLAALAEVDVFDQDYVQRGLEFLRMLAGVIGEMGLTQKRLLDQLQLSRSATEAALRASAEAEGARKAAELASAVRSRFFAAASHDLRQPIQAVRLFLDVLDAQLAGSPASEAAGKACEALSSAETLLTALFDVARIEAGVVAPKVQEMALTPLFDTLAQEWGPQAAAKGINLRFRPTRRRVTSDPLMLERVVRNLLANAIRYTSRGGVLVGCRARGEATVVEVWDTGPGIAPEHLNSIWEEFYQVGNASRNAAEGLGLGLSIARKLAASLGHRLDVRSLLGRGTVFRLTMPGPG